MENIKTAEDLRILRKKKLKQLIKRDLSLKENHKDLMREWSRTADFLIESALKIVLKDINHPPQFCVLALGKLGGMELNYSSDIDLLYIFEGDFETAVKIANRLTKLLNDIDEDGFVFRVDTNLRPEGKQGQIVNTIDALERYYEITGHEWERQALIRARPSAGDKTLGQEFINRVSPFVFRRSMDISALKKIRSTKIALEKSASAEGWRNIKLGEGGIREVEFIVQTLQILNGGKIKELRTTNTFDALDALLKNKIISPKKHKELTFAYLLLRRTENMIQAKDDRQTHTLPKKKNELEELANKLGFKPNPPQPPFSKGGQGGITFISKLDESRRAVQRHFADLFDTSYEKMEITEGMEANLDTCTNKEEIIDSLPWFKNHISKRIQELDLEGKLNIDEVSERLTFLAETIISVALKIARENTLANYGTARIENSQAADMTILGMGRLGNYEMDYGSDLDLVFIYSGDGETDGPKKITNHEYFTKAAQIVLSIITLPTRYGKAYNIDTELRPSGNQGTLVSSYEAFERYHRREAGLWERQALIRARVVGGDITLGNKITDLLEDLTYSLPLTENAKKEINLLRDRAINEKQMTPGQIDLKKGAGGLADIESIVHYLQLLHGQKNPKLRIKRLSLALEALFNERIITGEEYKILNEAYILYRRIIARMRLFAAHSTSIIVPKEEYFSAVGASLEKIQMSLEKTRKVYSHFLSLSSRPTPLPSRGRPK